jgi:hypothetical protein
MFGSGQFIYVEKYHFITDDVMAHEGNIIYCHIITDITTDDGTVVQTNRQLQVVKFNKEGFQFANADKAIEGTVLDQLWIEFISYQHFGPVIGMIGIFFQGFYFCIGELAVSDAAPVLDITEMVFILSFG